MKRILGMILALTLCAGLFALPASAESSGWSIANTDFARGTLTVETYAESDGMTLTLDGASVEGGEVTQSGGYYRRSFTVNTKTYADGEKTFAFFVNGVKTAEKAVRFDNTAPYIRSWQAIDALGRRYTAYDMEIYPDDIIVLSYDESFPVDFSPTDDGCGVASVTAKLDGKSIPVPYAVEYDYITAGYHNLNYTLTDRLGNSSSSTVRFEVRKPAPSYSNVGVSAESGGVRLSAKLSGSFTNYTAKFFFAEILKFSAKDNITFGDISSAEPAGERPFGADFNGSFITETKNGGEIYQCFDVNVSGKTGRICADYNGELATGDAAELSVYNNSAGAWEVIKTKTSFNGSVSLNFGKNGINIADYAAGGVLKARVRVVSSRTTKYIKTDSFVPSVRYNSQIGETQTGANNSVASVLYTGNVTSSLGWYVAGTADLYNSYSPTRSFSAAEDKSALLEQFNATFSGDTATRVSLSWQSETDLKTHVQLLPYGYVYPDFTSNETKNYTGSTSFSEETGKYVHKLRITGLKAGAKYWIRYGDKNRNVWSHPCVVETASGDETFAFAACSPSGSESAVRDVWNSVSRSTGASFVLTTGGEASGEAEWNSFFSAFGSVFNNVRAVPAAGAEGSGVWWTKYNVSEQTGAGHASGIYYSFTYKNALFVVLNSNDLDASGRLSARQLSWADRTFAASESDWNFLLLNAPLTGDAEASALAAQLIPLLAGWKVDVVFSSGGGAVSFEGGGEVVTLDGADYYAGASPVFVNTAPASAGMATVAVDGSRLSLEYGDAAVGLFSTVAFEKIDARISALPDAENITLDDMAEIRAIRALCDSEDAGVCAAFVTGLPKLEAAETALGAILAAIPPTLTVSGALPKKALLGSVFTPPAASADDLSDGALAVVIAAAGPEGEPAFTDGAVTFAEYGVYTVTYTAVDSDGNETSESYEITVREYSRFDMNNDGRVTVSDALMALRIAARLVAADTIDVAAGDADADGRITVGDALRILRAAVGLSDID